MPLARQLRARCPRPSAQTSNTAGTRIHNGKCTRRPSVVHAWQDSTSIKAGIAAVIAGVPRIVLASRNATPINFTYYQDYMYPAYRALASLESIVFLNNSEAGAVDYTQWLGMPRERFVVVRNGVDLNHLKRIEETVIRDYRQSLGIPADAFRRA